MGRIQQTRYDNLIRRTTDQYGGGSKVGEALEDLFPVIDVENTPSELLRATGWKLGAGQSSQVPAAATRAAIQLFNPAGSGHLIVLTSVTVSVNTAGPLTSGPSFTALATTSTPGQQRDTRAAVLAETVGLIQEQDDGLVANLFSPFLAANVIFVQTDPNDIAVLTPGTGWRVSTNADDITLRVSFLWRERVANPAELNF